MTLNSSSRKLVSILALLLLVGLFLGYVLGSRLNLGGIGFLYIKIYLVLVFLYVFPKLKLDIQTLFIIFFTAGSLYLSSNLDLSGDSKQVGKALITFVLCAAPLFYQRKASILLIALALFAFVLGEMFRSRTAQAWSVLLLVGALTKQEHYYKFLFFFPLFYLIALWLIGYFFSLGDGVIVYTKSNDDRSAFIYNIFQMRAEGLWGFDSLASYHQMLMDRGFRLFDGSFTDPHNFFATMFAICGAFIFIVFYIQYVKLVRVLFVNHSAAIIIALSSVSVLLSVSTMSFTNIWFFMHACIMVEWIRKKTIAEAELNKCSMFNLTY